VSGRDEILELIKNLNEGGGCLKADELMNVFKKYVSYLPSGVVYKGIDGGLCVRSLVPLALKGLSLGLSAYTVSRYLSWKDFEVLVKHYLELSGYEAVRSVRLKSRRYEIDVLAVDLIRGLGLAIDCKHWSPGYSKGSKLRAVAELHRSKVELLGNECQEHLNSIPQLRRCKWLLPVVVTLTSSIRGYFKGSCYAVWENAASLHYFRKC
jgi:Holliday junction resolvase-like predicted endonuclease